MGISSLHPIRCRLDNNGDKLSITARDDGTTEAWVWNHPALQLSQADCVYYSKNAATNERGIPYAPFVERVEDYVTTRADVEKTLQSFQEMIS